MSTVPAFSEGQLKALVHLLGECGTGSDISRVQHHRGLEDRSGESTKWRRLYWVFLGLPKAVWMREPCARLHPNLLDSREIRTEE